MTKEGKIHTFNNIIHLIIYIKERKSREKTKKNGKNLVVIKKSSTFAPAKLESDALVAQSVAHLTLNQGVQGSSPCRRTSFEWKYPNRLYLALVAQLVEHLTLNQGVQGSSPCRRTNNSVMAASFRCLPSFFLRYSNGQQSQ